MAGTVVAHGGDDEDGGQECATLDGSGGQEWPAHGSGGACSCWWGWVTRGCRVEDTAETAVAHRGRVRTDEYIGACRAGVPDPPGKAGWKAAGREVSVRDWWRVSVRVGQECPAHRETGRCAIGGGLASAALGSSRINFHYTANGRRQNFACAGWEFAILRGG
jgi:hypothetical protein